MPPHLQRASLALAILFTVVATAMTATVGWNFAGLLLALAFAGITIGAALLPTLAAHVWAQGSRVGAGCMAAAAVVFGVAEYMAHVSYSVTHRSAEVETVGHQSTAYADTRAQIAAIEQAVKYADEQLAFLGTLQAPEAYQAELATLEGHLIWTRTKQCTDATVPESIAFCAQYGTVKAALANAGEKLIIQRERLAALDKLAALRQTAEAKTPGVSMAATTDTLVAQMATFSLRPTSDARAAANIGIGGWLALAIGMGAAVFWFAAYPPVPARASSTDTVVQPTDSHLTRLVAGLEKSRRDLMQGRFVGPTGDIVVNGVRLSAIRESA